ncbi:MAG TPA: hypothetical protein EYM50_04495 [Nitrososphaerales archaeon]|jgi:hypothetical protein|nr:hypothetical protein [Nitrososphaerales archaeon]
MAVKLLRLKSGEDIVGDVVLGKIGQNITIENPAMLMPMSDGRGNQVQVGLAPWMPFSSEKRFDVPGDWVLLLTEPAQDIVNNYNQVFGSGIVVPKVSTSALLNE